MKKIKTILAIAILAFVLPACKRELTADDKVSELVNRALQSGLTEKQIQEIDKAYKNLSPQELEVFFDLSAERMFDESDIKQDETNQKNDINFIKSTRREILQKSLDTYKLPFNKLNTEQSRVLFKTSATPNPAIKENGCTIQTYPYKSCRTYTYNTSCSGYSNYSTASEPDDCDIEFRFAGNRTKVYGTSWFAGKLIEEWGACNISRRHSDSYTRLLFGQYGVYFWVGTASFTQGRLKME